MDPRRAEVRESLTALAVNTAVWIIRLYLGLLSGSMALVADAWHSLSDNFSSAAILIGSRVAAKPPDEEHPYGHGRVADLISLAIGSALIAIAALITYEAIHRLGEGYSLITEYAPYAIAGIVLTSAIKELLARYALRLHRISGSPMCRADAWHHRVDALTGFAAMPVFIAALINACPRLLDLAGSVIISAMLVREGLKIATDSVRDLLDSLKLEIAEAAAKAALSVSGVLAVHDVRVRSYGGIYYIDMKVHVDPDASVEEAHRISEIVESVVKESLGKGRVAEVLIHYEPATPHD